MPGILMHFLRRLVSTGAGYQGRVDGAGADAACHNQTDLGLKTQCVLAQRADRIVEFVDYL
jgi:hypothetical protein